MCIQITERYAVCGCLYYKHAVDWCSAINTRGHTTQKKEVPVGNACSQHSSNEPDESPRGQVAQHIDPYGSPAADPLTRLSVSEQIGKSDPRLPETLVSFSPKQGAGDDISIQSRESSLFSDTSTSSCSSIYYPEFAEELLQEFIGNRALSLSTGLLWKLKPEQFVSLCSDGIRIYANKLRVSANTLLQTNAAKLVRRHTVFLAEGLKAQFGVNQKVLLSRESPHQLEHRLAALDSHVDDADEEIDAGFYPRLDEVKKFLMHGWPFNDLVRRMVASARATSKTPILKRPRPTRQVYPNTIFTRYDRLLEYPTKEPQHIIEESQNVATTDRIGQFEIERHRLDKLDGSYPAPSNGEEVLLNTDRAQGELVLDGAIGRRTVQSGVAHTDYGPSLTSFTSILPKFSQLVLLVVFVQRLQFRLKNLKSPHQRTPNSNRNDSPFTRSVSDLIPLELREQLVPSAIRKYLPDISSKATCNETTPLLDSVVEEEEILWQCSCGKIVQEKVEELSPGGVAHLLKDIDGTVKRNPLEMGHYPRGRRSKLSGRIGNLLNLFSHTSHFIMLGLPTLLGGSIGSSARTSKAVKADSKCTKPVPNKLRKASLSLAPTITCSPASSSTRSSSPRSVSQPSSSATLTEPYAWVHLCIEKRSGVLHLQSVNIRSLVTDGPVFSAIHDAYFGQGLVSRLRSIFSLRVLEVVQCVHFNLDRHNHIAIEEGEHQRLPPPPTYDYSPCPPEVTGLIPRQFLYLYIMDPTLTYGHYTTWRERLPKYTGAELRCPASKSFAQGYGLYFIRALSWIRVFMVMALLAIASFTFAGLWTRYHQHSIQDAFTMGGSILSVATIFLGLMHGLDASWSQAANHVKRAVD